MGAWLRRMWNDETSFKGFVRSLFLGVAIASTTAAGAKIMDDKADKITTNQWIRFGIAVCGAMVGGAIVSTKRDP